MNIKLHAIYQNMDENDELYNAGLTTEQALKILHEDIENVVLREELKFSSDRFV